MFLFDGFNLFSMEQRVKDNTKEARRGMERDVDYDAVLLEKIRNRGSQTVPDAGEDDLEYLSILVPAEGR